MVSAHFDSFWLFLDFNAQISQPVCRKIVHTLQSMDTFLVFFESMDRILLVFLTKYTKKVFILCKVWTTFSRKNLSAKEVWTGFMLSCVNSCPYNSRFVANFTVICQIYVRKIEICSQKFTTTTPNLVIIYDIVTKIGDNIINRYQIHGWI